MLLYPALAPHTDTRTRASRALAGHTQSLQGAGTPPTCVFRMPGCSLKGEGAWCFLPQVVRGTGQQWALCREQQGTAHPSLSTVLEKAPANPDREGEAPV